MWQLLGHAVLSPTSPRSSGRFFIEYYPCGKGREILWQVVSSTVFDVTQNTLKVTINLRAYKSDKLRD